MNAVWRCRVCEAVNQGGRTCATCGAVVPLGEPLRAAVKARVPATRRAEPPPPVPPTPRRRDLRELPSSEELRLADPFDLFSAPDGVDIRPLPGGCLVSLGPRRSRRRRGWL